MASYNEISKGRYKLFVELGYDAEGKRKRKTKTVAASGPREAARLLREFENEVMDTLHLEDENPPFEKFYDRWKENYGELELSASTLEKYEEMSQVVVPYFKRKRIKDITTFHIVQFFSKERKEGRGSLEKKYNLLQSIFKFAVKWKIIDVNTNPMDGVDRPKVKAKKADFYTGKEINVLMKLINELDLYQQLIVKLALSAGLRRGEIIGIADDVLDFSNNQILIKRSLQYTKTEGFKLKATKTEDERTVTIPKNLMKELHAFYLKKLNIRMEFADRWHVIKDEDGKEVMLLFSNDDGKPYRPDSITQFWNRFMIRHPEIKRIRFHDLRHSSASYALSQGVNLKVIQKRLGHKKFKTTMDTYSHVTQEDDKKASDVFEDFF